MDLYLIRHADAGNRAEWNGNDANRPLTPLGRCQAKSLGEMFKKRGLVPGAILTSPFTRTWQTAGDFREAAQPDGKDPQLCDLLVPGELRRRKLSKVLASLGVDSVAIVGHDPDLPSYLAWLVGTDPEQVTLEKGGVALVKFEDGPGKGEGVLTWMVTPEWYLPAECAKS